MKLSSSAAPNGWDEEVELKQKEVFCHYVCEGKRGNSTLYVYSFSNLHNGMAVRSLACLPFNIL